jgi:hypothetical protein
MDKPFITKAVRKKGIRRIFLVGRGAEVWELVEGPLPFTIFQ